VRLLESRVDEPDDLAVGASVITCDIPRHAQNIPPGSSRRSSSATEYFVSCAGIADVKENVMSGLRALRSKCRQ
jgi:hypothetical protein